MQAKAWASYQIAGIAKDSIEKGTKDGSVDINMSSIVDSEGNKRFIEGAITINEITGVTQNYGKWSLSGTHLMLVLVLTVQTGITLSSGTILAVIANIPNWIREKIVPIHNDAVSVVHSYNIGSGSDTDCYFSLRKRTSDFTIVPAKSGITTAREEHIRIEFDYLIDAD